MEELELSRTEAPTEELSNLDSELSLAPLKNFFDINDSAQDKNLELIHGWAAEKGIKSNADLQLEIRRIEMKLGAPEIGQSRVSRLAKYLILDGKMTQLMKEMQSYEKL